MKRILLTGGAGFIGSNFLRYLLKNYNYKIINLDKLTYAGNIDNIRDLLSHPNHVFIKGDICDKKKVEEIIKKYRIDTIINFAAETHVDRSLYYPKEFIQTNYYGVFTLLEATRKFKLEKFVQISTDEVYGSIEKGYADENTELNPTSPYSASKASADLLVQAYFKTYKTPTIIIRSSNNYGPYQYPEKIIPLFITNLLENKKIPLYGDGKNIRDWLFVDDNSSAIALILTKGKPGEIYNVSAEQLLSNYQLTLKILNLLNKSQNHIQLVKDRPAHDFRYAMKSEKIKKLGWRTTVNIDEGLKKTIQWYITNKWWWEKIKSKKNYKEFYTKHYHAKENIST